MAEPLPAPDDPRRATGRHPSGVPLPRLCGGLFQSACRSAQVMKSALCLGLPHRADLAQAWSGETGAARWHHQPLVAGGSTRPAFGPQARPLADRAPAVSLQGHQSGRRCQPDPCRPGTDGDGAAARSGGHPPLKCRYPADRDVYASAQSAARAGGRPRRRSPPDWRICPRRLTWTHCISILHVLESRILNGRHPMRRGITACLLRPARLTRSSRSLNQHMAVKAGKRAESR